jgi:hypothetical protein
LEEDALTEKTWGLFLQKITFFLWGKENFIKYSEGYNLS